ELGGVREAACGSVEAGFGELFPLKSVSERLCGPREAAVAKTRREAQVQAVVLVSPGASRDRHESGAIFRRLIHLSSAKPAELLPVGLGAFRHYVSVWYRTGRHRILRRGVLPGGRRRLTGIRWWLPKACPGRLTRLRVPSRA